MLDLGAAKKCELSAKRVGRPGYFPRGNIASSAWTTATIRTPVFSLLYGKYVRTVALKVQLHEAVSRKVPSRWRKVKCAKFKKSLNKFEFCALYLPRTGS